MKNLHCTSLVSKQFGTDIGFEELALVGENANLGFDFLLLENKVWFISKLENCFSKVLAIFKNVFGLAKDCFKELVV